MKDPLGDRMKGYEAREAGRRLMPLIPVIARIDGRRFSAFTRGLDRPFDPRLSTLMIETTRFLVRETCAACGYTQSDEITLTWYSPGGEAELLFDGRVQKLDSVLASLTTAYFHRHLSAYLPAEYADRLPHFDARTFNVPTPEEGANCFLWREADATKNSISMAAQAYYSHDQLTGKSGSEKQDLLWRRGINWDSYPDFFKRGTFVRRRTVVGKLAVDDLDALPEKHHARTNPELMVTRSECVRLTLPPLARVVNRVGVIYRGEDPVTQAATAVGPAGEPLPRIPGGGE